MAIVNSRAAIEPKTGKAAIFVNETIHSLIRKLFANNEQGFFYDPNDLTTMFQDASGTVPVAAMGQPVGLVLDKSRGLTLGSNKSMVSTIVGTGIGATEFKSTTVATDLKVGTHYLVSIDVVNYSGSGDLGIVSGGATANFLNGGALSRRSSNGKIFYIGLATASSLGLYTRASNNADFTNISIKELAGNHAYQTVSASRPTLSSRVNMLTGTDTLANWSIVNIGKVDNTLKAVGGTPVHHICHKTFTYIPSSMITYYAEVTKGSGFCFFQLCYSNTNRFKCTINLATGEHAVKKLLTNTTTVVVEDGGDVWKLTLTGSATGTSGTAYANMGFATSLSDDTCNTYDEPVFLANGSESMTIKAIDVRETHIGSNLPKYQRVTSPTDYDSVGFPNYLVFDGVDDFLQTNNIDFTATDKVSLFAGVRKLSDAAVGTLLELSTSSANNGTFSILAPSNAGLARYGVSTRGINTTALQASSAPDPHAAPISSVLTAKLDSAKGDSAANAIKVRHNGENMLASADGLNSTTPANFGDYPLYIGRRSGTALSFNGHIYSLIGIGRLTTDTETIALEKSIAKNTGVTLSV